MARFWRVVGQRQSVRNAPGKLNAMTITKTLAQIKALGIRARYISETREYVLSQGDNEYFTDSAEDALNTARSMAAGNNEFNY